MLKVHLLRFDKQLVIHQYHKSSSSSVKDFKLPNKNKKPKKTPKAHIPLQSYTLSYCVLASAPPFIITPNFLQVLFCDCHRSVLYFSWAYILSPVHPSWNATMNKFHTFDFGVNVGLSCRRDFRSYFLWLPSFQLKRRKHQLGNSVLHWLHDA